uniref:hypothetical protein n=1 Tax=Polynucleobacter sp. TaxID=2029855 RepID=UPI004048E35C
MLSIKDALIAYAKMMNNLNSIEFESLLDGNFSYESQAVLTPITSKQEFIDYIRQKLSSLKTAKGKIFAELAQLNAYGQTDCVVVAQGEKDNLVATVFITIADNKITKVDMCLVPEPRFAARSGIYPI